MEFLHEQRNARKLQLLAESEQDVLVITSRRFLESWSPELLNALADCCQRGLKVKVLIERTPLAWRPLARKALRKMGAELRWAPRRFLSSLRTMPVQGEIWVFDRREIITANQRSRRPLAEAENMLSVECQLGAAVAKAAAAYFDLLWEANPGNMGFSVRHKQFAFHSGIRAEAEFFSCLASARRMVTICLPSGRLSRRLSQALQQALADGLHVTVFANADRDSTHAVRRLRRLAMQGATVKICGGRLASECALVDDRWVYMGSMPRSWGPWFSPPCPVFVVNNSEFRQEVLNALESQVSVEFNSPLLGYNG
jgi:hypothetical protein